MQTVEVEQITLLTLYYFILKWLNRFPFFLISNHLSHLKQINSWGEYVLRAFIWSLLPGKLLLLSVCVLKLTDSVDCFVTSDDKRQQGPTSLHVVSEWKKQRLSQHRPSIWHYLPWTALQNRGVQNSVVRICIQLVVRWWNKCCPGGWWVGGIQRKAFVSAGESSAGGLCVRYRLDFGGSRPRVLGKAARGNHFALSRPSWVDAPHLESDL